MKRLYLHILWLSVLTAGLSGCQKEEIVRSDVCESRAVEESAKHPKAAAFEALLDKYIKQGLPGIILLIRNANGRWVGAAGKADIGRNIPMQNCHVSKVASINKMMMGALTLKLEDEGVLHTNDRLSDWIAEETLEGIANAGDVELRQLLNHTSGIYDVISDGDFFLAVLDHPSRRWTAEDLLGLVRGKAAAFPAGKDVGYSNTNFVLLALAIEAATGKPHHQVMREKIIEPLGMWDTHYDWHEPLPEHTAQGYLDLYNEGSLLNLSNYRTGSGNGHTGIYSNVFDLQLFVEALLDSRTLISDSARNKMLTFTATDENEDRNFGLGIYHDFLERDETQQSYGHRGRDLAYSADCHYFPKLNVTFVCLVNYGTNASSELQDVYFDFRDEVVDLLLEP